MADTYLLPCPECNATIPVTVRMAGQDISCSQCGVSTEVPRLGTMKQLARETNDTDGKSSSGSSSRFASALFSLGLLALAVGAIGGFFLHRYAGNMISPVDVQTEVIRTQEQLDEFPSYMIWDLWDSFEKQELGEYRETGFVQSNAQGRILMNVAYGLFALSGLGLLAMIVSLAIRRKKADAQ